jgi:integrase/recombinase XerD
MKTLPQAVQDYLAMRRALGYQLLNAGPALEDFVSFLKRKRTSYITITIALKWAQKAGAQPATWANRLALVRGFARYRSATDPRTEVPPSRVLSWRSKRATPYLYTDDEVRLLLNVCLSLSPHDALRKWTYRPITVCWVCWP